MFIALTGAGFPSAFDSGNWRFLVNFFGGNGTAVFIGGLRFWFSLLGYDATFSEDVDESAP